MRIKLVTLLTVAFGLSFAQSASAADMPVKMPAKAAPVAVVDPWTGFYAGVNAGGVWGRAKAVDDRGWNHVGDTFTASTSGFTGGGQAGYNFRSGNVLFGVEAEVGYLGFHGSQPTPDSIGVPFDTTVVASGGVFTSVRGRIGYIWGMNLLYATGGYFGANVNARIEDALGATLFSDHTGFQSGWTAGAGWEYMFAPRWSAKFEYLYFDLGTKTVADPRIPTAPFDIKSTGNIVRVGLNYHFGAL